MTDSKLFCKAVGNGSLYQLEMWVGLFLNFESLFLLLQIFFPKYFFARGCKIARLDFCFFKLLTCVLWSILFQLTVAKSTARVHFDAFDVTQLSFSPETPSVCVPPL